MNNQFSITTLVLFSLILTAWVAHAQEEFQPQKVTTSLGIYDVESQDEIYQFSAKEIRELVQMENVRPQNAFTIPHPILIYCFDEKTFQYTGGQYQDAQIKYRLHKPKNIRYGRKYPLVVLLHGAGEAGTDNTSSLIYLHSILPVLIGPESEDFFMLVMQCPKENPVWNFQAAKDGTLDVLVALMEHVMMENSIDKKRITVAGVSSGGWGVWELISRYPDMFAGAVPTSSGAPPNLSQLSALRKTKIWSFINKEDSWVDPESSQIAMRAINGSGGSMTLTMCDAPGHNAWMPAMEDYNCLRWMLAQKRGSWFSPPPGTIVYNKSNSFLFIFFMGVVPLALIVFLSWGIIYDQISHVWQRIQERLGIQERSIKK